MLTLTPSHPGVHTCNLHFPPALPWLHTNLQFSNISFPDSCLFFHMQHKCFLGPAPCRQTALPAPPPALSNELSSKIKFFHNLFSLQILSKGYRSFRSTSKCCWQGHNWTSFPVQHRHYQRDDYPSWPYYSLPLATTSYPSPFGSYPTCSSGSSPFLPLLTFSKASPKATTCWPHPKKNLSPFWLQLICSRRLCPLHKQCPHSPAASTVHRLPPHVSCTEEGSAATSMAVSISTCNRLLVQMKINTFHVLRLKKHP